MIRTALGAVVLSSALLSACSFSAGSGTPTLKQAEVEQQTLTQLKAAGAPVAKVTCQGSLAGKIGATQRCVVTNTDGVTVGATLTVTSVASKRAEFHIQEDQTGTPASGAGSSSPSGTPSAPDTSQPLPSDTSGQLPSVLPT